MGIPNAIALIKKLCTSKTNGSKFEIEEIIIGSVYNLTEKDVVTHTN